MPSLTAQRQAVVIGAVAAFAISLSAAPYAQAQEMSQGVKISPTDIARALVNLETNVPGLLAKATHNPNVLVPNDPLQGVKLWNAEGQEIRVVIPNTSESAQKAVLAGGTSVYPSRGMSASATIERADGIQLLAYISGPQAPTSYTYKFVFSGTQRLDIREGVVVVRDASGISEFVIGTPWAVDAKGKRVSTFYEIRGSSLIQTVDHQSDPSISYPVIVDPPLSAGNVAQMCNQMKKKLEQCSHPGIYRGANWPAANAECAKKAIAEGLTQAAIAGATAFFTPPPTKAGLVAIGTINFAGRWLFCYVTGE